MCVNRLYHTRKGENAGTKSYEDWTPLKAFAVRKDCESWLVGGMLGTYDTRCLPDTVDPRGAKGK